MTTSVGAVNLGSCNNWRGAAISKNDKKGRGSRREQSRGRGKSTHQNVTGTEMWVQSLTNLHSHHLQVAKTCTCISCSASLAKNNWRCASFVSVTPAKKKRAASTTKIWYSDLISASEGVFPGILGDFLSPFILTKIRCFSVNQFHMWGHVGTATQICIFTSTDVHVWYQHVDQSFNDVTNRMLDVYTYVSIDIFVHVHIYNSIFQYVYRYMHTHIYVKVYVYIFTYMYMYMYIYTYIHIYLCTYRYIHMYIYTYCKYISIPVYTYIYKRTYIYVVYIYIHIYISFL